MSDAAPTRRARLLEALQRADSHPLALKAADSIRRRLPGDPTHGDPLSLAGPEPAQLLGQQLAARTAERPGALRELGFGALQVWQGVSEAQGRGVGDRELAIVFTDLVGFSDWTLRAGDEAAIELLRCVGKAIEPPIAAGGGRIVKRLGDGLMAVFDDAGAAVEAGLQAVRALGDVEVGGHRPQLRVGVHLGRPRRLGGDFFGVDVNVAARIAAAAGADEVLVSSVVHERLDGSGVELQRRWRFSAKGAPKDLKVFRAQPG